MALRSTSADPSGFRAALGSFASGVNVITMRDGLGRPLGMTATAFSSVSADPLLVLVCVNRSTRTYDRIAAGGRYGINMLGAGAREISDYCARPGADKVLHDTWLAKDEQWSSPALDGAVAFLDCRLTQEVVAGTHAILIGEVDGIGLSAAAPNHDPLLYFQGAYRPLQPRAARRRPQELPILLDEVAR